MIKSLATLALIPTLLMSYSVKADNTPSNWEWLSNLEEVNANNPGDLSVSISHLDPGKYPQFKNHDLIQITYKNETKQAQLDTDDRDIDGFPFKTYNLEYVLALWNNDEVDPEKALEIAAPQTIQFERDYQDSFYINLGVKVLFYQGNSNYFRTFSVKTNKNGMAFIGYEKNFFGKNSVFGKSGPTTTYESLFGQLDLSASCLADSDSCTVNDFSYAWDQRTNFMERVNVDHSDQSIAVALTDDNDFIIAAACKRSSHIGCQDNERIAFQVGTVADNFARSEVVTDMDVVGGRAIDTDFAIGENGRILEVHKNTGTDLYYTTNQISLPSADPLVENNNVGGIKYDSGRLPSIAYIGNDHWVTLHKGKSSDSQNITLFQDNPEHSNRARFTFEDDAGEQIKTNKRSDIDGTSDGKVVVALARDGKVAFRLAQINTAD